MYQSPQRLRINDATSDKELNKAMSTFLNTTGAGDYNLPKLTGDKVAESGKKNLPNWTLMSRTKLSWFPGRNVDFAGSSSPPSTNYRPPSDRPFKNTKFSVGRQSRFAEASSVLKVKK